MKQFNPTKAKELEELRKSDPDKFKAELMKTMQDMRNRMGQGRGGMRQGQGSGEMRQGQGSGEMRQGQGSGGMRQGQGNAGSGQDR